MVKLLTTFIILLSAAVPVFVPPAPSADVLKDLAPTGKLRAAINFSNGVLHAEKGPNGEPRPSVGRACERARQAPARGSRVRYLSSRGKSIRGRQPSLGGGCHRARVPAARKSISPHRMCSFGRLIGGERIRRLTRHIVDAPEVRRRWPRLGLRPLPDAHAEACDIGARAAGRCGRRHRAIRPNRKLKMRAGANR